MYIKRFCLIQKVLLKEKGYTKHILYMPLEKRGQKNKKNGVRADSRLGAQRQPRSGMALNQTERSLYWDCPCLPYLKVVVY